MKRLSLVLFLLFFMKAFFFGDIQDVMDKYRFITNESAASILTNPTLMIVVTHPESDNFYEFSSSDESYLVSTLYDMIAQTVWDYDSEFLSFTNESLEQLSFIPDGEDEVEKVFQKAAPDFLYKINVTPPQKRNANHSITIQLITSDLVTIHEEVYESDSDNFIYSLDTMHDDVMDSLELAEFYWLVKKDVIELVKTGNQDSEEDISHLEEDVGLYLMKIDDRMSVITFPGRESEAYYITTGIYKTDVHLWLEPDMNIIQFDKKHWILGDNHFYNDKWLLVTPENHLTSQLEEVEYNKALISDVFFSINTFIDNSDYGVIELGSRWPINEFWRIKTSIVAVLDYEEAFGLSLGLERRLTAHGFDHSYWLNWYSDIYVGFVHENYFSFNTGLLVRIHPLITFKVGVIAGNKSIFSVPAISQYGGMWSMLEEKQWFVDLEIGWQLFIPFGHDEIEIEYR